ncbi:MAG: hypothetical protein WB621_21510 [Candidatus Acidiferrales bacterium]
MIAILVRLIGSVKPSDRRQVATSNERHFAQITGLSVIEPK